MQEKVETERKRWIVGDEVGGMRGESRRANRTGGGGAAVAPDSANGNLFT